MGKLTSLFMLAAGLYGVYSAAPPTVKFARMLAAAGSSPVPAKVAEATVGRWTTLTDAKLRCDSRAVYDNATTFFLATDAGTANPFVVQFVGVVACEAAQTSITGAFDAEPMTLAHLAHYGIDSKGATGLRLFTPTVTPKYLKVRLVPPVVILLIGAGMALFGARGLLRRERDRP